MDDNELLQEYVRVLELVINLKRKLEMAELELTAERASFNVFQANGFRKSDAWSPTMSSVRRAESKRDAIHAEYSSAVAEMGRQRFQYQRTRWVVKATVAQ